MLDFKAIYVYNQIFIQEAESFGIDIMSRLTSSQSLNDTPQVYYIWCIVIIIFRVIRDLVDNMLDNDLRYLILCDGIFPQVYIVFIWRSISLSYRYVKLGPRLQTPLKNCKQIWFKSNQMFTFYIHVHCHVYDFYFI